MRWRSSPQWVVRGSIVSVVLSLVIAACVTSEHPRPTCVSVADGGPARIDPPDGTMFVTVPSTDAQATTVLGIEEDPGPTCTDCKAGDDYEIMSVVDFEEGFAPAWIDYGEPGTTVEPHGVGAACGAPGPPPPYFGLQAVDLGTLPGGARCQSRYALHLEGGPFKTWGGGYATQFMSVRGRKFVDQYCPATLVEGPETTGTGTRPQASPDGENCSFWTAPVKSQPSRVGIDASQFDGVSLWARRGPGGASTLRVALLDSNTAQESALSAELQGKEPACKRVVSCCQVCTELKHEYLDAGMNGDLPLSVGEETDYRCYVPGEPLPPVTRDGGDDDAGIFYYRNTCMGPDTPWLTSADAGTQDIKGAWDGWNRNHKPCCPKTVTEDPKYGGDDAGECSAYVFKYDYSSGYYCQKGDEKLPERNDNRCEDGFEAPIVIDTEWKLFRIPWAEMRRSTLGRPPIDPHAIWTIRLYPGAGWLDTYVNDIGFYRKRQ